MLSDHLEFVEIQQVDQKRDPFTSSYRRNSCINVSFLQARPAHDIDGALAGHLAKRLHGDEVNAYDEVLHRAQKP
jgi:hypothetical protein